MDKKVAAKEWTLFKGVIDGEDGLRNDVLVVNIGGDADDAMRGGANPGGELEHWIRPKDVPIDGILIGEHTLCESLTDDDDRLTALFAVPLAEMTVTAAAHAEDGEQAVRDDAHPGTGVGRWRLDLTGAGDAQDEPRTVPGRH